MTADQKVIPARRAGGLTIALQRAFMKAHIALYRLTGGKIGGKFGNETSCC